jgi:hypothetical protein
VKLTVEDLVLVAYDIPPERVKPLLPRRFSADTLPGAQGSRAFVTTVVYRVRFGQPGSIPARLPIHVARHAICVKRDGASATYTLRSFTSPMLLGSALRLLLPVSRGAQWSEVRTMQTSSAGAAGPMTRIGFHSTEESIDLTMRPAGPSELDPGPFREALKPFLLRPQKAFFLVRGLLVWGHWIWKTGIPHSDPEAYPLEPVRIKLPYWQEIGLVSAAEIERPAAFFHCPSIPVDCGMASPDIAL